jgi:TonB-linked SusC/RagA family outer membrane protein
MQPIRDIFKNTLFFIFCFGFLSMAAAQNKTITGTITDTNLGETLPGVSVLEKGTFNGTVSNIDGKFSITLQQTEGAILQFNLMGYQTVEIPVADQTTINVELTTQATALDEVVVVGYGSQQRASVVGAISVARVDEIENISAANLSNSIGGRISGVISRSGEGQPGNDDATLLIRGRSTTNDASPLVLVDGVESSLNRINPNDIESFSVLKDASATAVYGVRGANGVILITTKRGQKGKPVIRFNSQLRMHSIIAFPEFLNSYDYARLYNEARWNGGNTDQFYSDDDLALYQSGESPYTHPDINWYDEMVRPFFPEHRHDISMSGGGNFGKYYISAEYLSQDGAYRQWDNMEYATNNAYDRINLRSNFDFDLHQNTQLQVNLMTRTQNVRSPNTGDFYGGSRSGFWDNIIVTRPNVFAPLNPDGSYGTSLDSRNVERGYMQLREGGYRSTRTNEIEGSLRLNQDFDFLIPGLEGRIIYNLSTLNGYAVALNETPATYIYNPTDSSYTMISRANLPSYNLSGGRFTKRNYLETALTYSNTFGQNHDVGALLLYNINSFTNQNSPPASQLGFAGRITYGYKNKYLAEFNAGYNGSDQFMSGNRFAFLPAFSLGWTISEEEFFTSDAINHLKIRGSYGTVANDRIGNFRYLYESRYYESFPSNPGDAWNSGYNFGVTPGHRPGIYEGTMGNDQVTWETAVKQNVGLDLWMFKSMLNISVDVFTERRTDILDRRNTITNIFGMARDQLPPQNIGEVQNQGFEAEVRTMPSIGNIRFNISGNFSFARNKRIFFDEVIQELDYQNATGRPIGQNFGYTWTGLFYSFEDLGYVWDDESNDYFLPDNAEALVPVPDDGVSPGDLRFLDRNDDGIIDSYDVGFIGKSSTPEYIYGLNLGIEYKGFSINTFWQGAGGFTNHNPYLMEFVNGAKAHEIHLGRWAYFPEMGIDTRATATYPRLEIDASSQTRKWSTFRTFNGEYFRLKNLEIAYSLPGNWLEEYRLSNLRVYITGTNLLTFSKLPYVDPEAPMGTASFYPQTRYYGAGVSANF